MSPSATSGAEAHPPARDQTVPPPRFEVPAGPRTIVVDRARKQLQLRRRSLGRSINLNFKRRAPLAFATNLEPVTVAFDQIGLLPDNGIAHRHGDRVIGLATAGAASVAVDGSLPANTGAKTSLGPPAVSVGPGRLPASFNWGSAATHI